MKLKKLSDSRFIPQKLLIFESAKKVETPKTIINKRTALLKLFQTKLILPKTIILINQKIRIKKQNTASNVCLFKATGETVHGRKKIGIKKTNEYKPYLIKRSK